MVVISAASRGCDSYLSWRATFAGAGCRVGAASDDQEDAFRAWCSIWRFRAQEAKETRLLGDELWEAQDMSRAVDHGVRAAVG